MNPMIWLNGALIAADRARIAPNDRGFLLGDGLFETIRVKDGTPLRLSEHIARLDGGCTAFGIALPDLDWPAEIARLIEASAAGLAENGVLRLTISRGPGGRGLVPDSETAPTVMMTLGPLPAPKGSVRATICRVTVRSSMALTSRWKTLNYLDQIAARREAMAHGFDDALMLNEFGRLSCATAANLFIRHSGIWSTPPLGEGALPGTARAHLLTRLEVREELLNPEMMPRAEAVILTNALGCTPLAELDGHLYDSDRGKALAIDFNEILDLS